MAVPWVLHGVTFDEREMIVDLDLIQRVESIVIALVVTATNKVKLLSIWLLNALEVVREAAVVVWLNLEGVHSLLSEIQLVDILRVFLKEVNYLNIWSVIFVPNHIEYRLLILLHQ